LFKLEFFNPAAGWEKDQVEKSVRDTRYRIWQTAPSFKSLDELNAWLEKRCMALWQVHDHLDDKRHTIAQMWQKERSHLMPMPQSIDACGDVIAVPRSNLEAMIYSVHHVLHPSGLPLAVQTHSRRICIQRIHAPHPSDYLRRFKIDPVNFVLSESDNVVL